MNLLPRFKNLFAKPANQVILETSRELGFPMREIRQALITLNKVSLTDLVRNARANGHPLSLPTMSRALKGINSNTRRVQTARTLVADSLNLDVRELFPEGFEN